VQAGHNCIACASPHFWGQMSPFYERLPNVPGFGADTTAETVGLAIVGAVAAASAAHAVGKGIQGAHQRRAGTPATAGAATPGDQPRTPEPQEGSGAEDKD
jgi:hydrogenase small subunit